LQKRTGSNKVNLRVMFLTDAGKVIQAGSFPMKGRRPELIAFEWIQGIKREVTYKELIKVVLDGEHDITHQVLQLEKAPLR
jgi:hypothetical protein